MRRPGKGVIGVAGVLLLVVAVGALLTRSLLHSGASGSSASEARVLVLFNQARASHRLRPLTTDARLARSAQSHSDSMLRQGYFSHDGPQGIWDVRIGRYVTRSVLAEILAYGSGPYSTPRGLMNAWMHSPEHRRIILTPGLRFVGVGITTGTYRGTHGVAMATADFSN